MAKVDRQAAVSAALLNGAWEFGTALAQFALNVYLVRKYVKDVDFGASAAVIAALAALQPFGASMVMRRVLQLPGDAAPDWGRHFRLAAAFQAACAVAMLGYAWLLTRSAAHAGVPALLALAVLGMALDIVAQWRVATLLRALDFRRYRMVLAATKAAGLATYAGLAIAGQPALGMVLMNSVVSALVFALDGAWTRCWRQPVPAEREGYGAIARFVLLQGGAGVAYAARAALESACLPRWLGLAGMGQWNRAPALSASTVGRVQTVLGDSVLPMLPHTVGDPPRFRAFAVAYLEAIALLAIPSGIFLASFGPILNLALFGEQWANVNPLLVAGALLPMAQAFGNAAQNILFGAGLIRRQVLLSTLGSVLGILALAGAWWFRTPFAYGWSLLAAELVGLAFTIHAVHAVVGTGAFRKATLAPTAAALAAWAGATAADLPAVGWGYAPRIAWAALSFGLAFFLTLRLAFPAWLGETLDRVPRTAGLRRWLRLPPAAPA